MNTEDQILSITHPKNGTRARKVVTRSRARPTGKYPSWKMGRMLQWESQNELNAFRLLDANPAIIAYQEQPLIIHYRLDGEVHDHYPDVLVRFRQTKELWEIKPAAQASRAEVTARTRLMEKALPRFGFAYRVILAEDLAKKPLLSNVFTILKFGRQPVPPISRERIRQTFRAQTVLTWGAIRDGAFGRDGMSYVCRLALEGRLRIDLEVPMTRATTITWIDTNSSPAKGV